jgi:septum formation protein
MEKTMDIKGTRVVLASKSPRRKQLLGSIIPEFEIITKDTDETLPEGMHPSVGVGVLAERKGAAVADTLPSDALVISSDTLVELGGVPLGKPVSEEDALRMLLSLSGKTHNVHTGVCVHYKGRVYTGVDTAHVSFREITEAEALAYIATGEPMDKAGSYAIQGGAKKFICGFRGDYNAIVGLGLDLTERLVREALESD